MFQDAHHIKSACGCSAFQHTWFIERDNNSRCCDVSLCRCVAFLSYYTFLFCTLQKHFPVSQCLPAKFWNGPILTDVFQPQWYVCIGSSPTVNLMILPSDLPINCWLIIWMKSGSVYSKFPSTHASKPNSRSRKLLWCLCAWGPSSWKGKESNKPLHGLFYSPYPTQVIFPQYAR